jgi:hypothetical protein
MSVPDPNIKQIRLVGGAEELSMGSSRKRGGARGKNASKTYKVGKEGGGTSPGTLTQLAASHLPSPAPGSMPAAAPVGVSTPPMQTAAPVKAVGGAPAPVRVVLAAAKKKKGKVLLAAAKTVAPLAHAHAKTKKVKVARKVRVSMAGLSRKINKAKDIRQKATGDSIEEIKKSLEKAGLIKKESKAPETMLRQMYADFMMLKKRAL